VRSTRTGEIGTHDRLTAEAACPSGTRLIAGGGSALPSGGDVALAENEPISKSTWKVTVVRVNNNGGDKTTTAEARAICIAVG
jgi:hypothetical protein